MRRSALLRCRSADSNAHLADLRILVVEEVVPGALKVRLMRGGLDCCITDVASRVSEAEELAQTVRATRPACGLI